MAYEIPGFVYSGQSEGEIGQFRAVVVNSDGEVEAAGGDAAQIDGVAQMPAAAAQSESIRVMKTGITFAQCSQAVTRGNLVRTVAGGRFRPVADPTAPANYLGRALTSTGGENELFALLLY